MYFKQQLQYYIPLIEQELTLFLDEHLDNNILTPLIKQFVLNGGKRLRPIALIESYKACGGTDESQIIKAAIAVELYHNSTLIHDDIMDEDTHRRGKPTIFKSLLDYYQKDQQDNTYDGILFNKKSALFATSQAILAGNILTELSKLPLLESSFVKKTQATEILVKAAQIVNNGQVEDIILETIKQPTEQQYYQMIEQKTGQLFVASIKIGAILANASEKEINNLTRYAKLAATTFQLQDDLLDLTNNKGHEIGSDIKQGKTTLLIIKALEKADEQQKQILLSAFKNEYATEEQIEQAINILEETNAMSYTKSLALQKIKEGKTYTTSPFFLGFADYMIERDI